VRGGVKYAIGVTIVIAFSMVVEFSWVAVGLSALLAWLVNVPGPRHDRLNGIVIYIVVGAGLIGLVYALSGTYWPWLISMVVVAFLGTFTMMNVNAGAMIFFFILPYSVVWGALDGEAGHVIANERIIAELIGVMLAGIAVSMREMMARKLGEQQ
jgi:hypothetical protein